MSPYRDLPDRNFWKRAMLLAPEQIDPIGDVPFKIGKADPVATAGSCFAQHISRALSARGFNYLVTEPGGNADGYEIFPARFGNIYTTRQLLQLFQIAYGLRAGSSPIWQRGDGRLVDGYRPLAAAAGFGCEADLLADRAKHLAAVRAMFERCNVFIFTLGLTEAWVSTETGCVMPSAPGAQASPMNGEAFDFANLSVPDMVSDMCAFIDKLRVVNPSVRLILTVSPVPLIATYERRHVLVSTIYSKSALRVVAEMVCKARPDVAYFPSYEIITGHHHGYRLFEPDLRSVSNGGVDHVMEIFARHFIDEDVKTTATQQQAPRTNGPSPPEKDELYEIVCDEEALIA